MADADVNAIRSYYDLHADSLFAYFAHRVGRDLAEDLLAETFRNAIESLATFDSQRGSARAWLFGIGTNLLRQHWRIEQRRLLAHQRLAGSPSTGIDPLLRVAERIDAYGDAGRLLAAVVNLPAEDRDLLILSGWEHLTSAEIGEALGLSAGAVRTRLHRIRADLRRIIDQPSRRDRGSTGAAL